LKTKIFVRQRGCFANSRDGYGGPLLFSKVSAEERGFSALIRSWPRFAKRGQRDPERDIRAGRGRAYIPKIRPIGQMNR